MTNATLGRKDILLSPLICLGRCPTSSPTNGTWWNYSLRRSLSSEARPALSLPAIALMDVIHLLTKRDKHLWLNGSASTGSVGIGLFWTKVLTISQVQPNHENIVADFVTLVGLYKTKFSKALRLGILWTNWENKLSLAILLTEYLVEFCFQTVYKYEFRDCCYYCTIMWWEIFCLSFWSIEPWNSTLVP